MVCTQVSVVDPLPVITNLQAIDKGNNVVQVTWSQDIPGIVNIQFDGSTPNQDINIGVPGEQSVLFQDIQAGNHTVCVTAV